ncbi:hypothetical protein [Saccharopolyspora sp. 6V]|uniref:hypothetical protein n=1 Tax=Saccharopolyspora sp. 6V TaxID=2877239 RepID=UPI001CD4ABC6|nr:hypothetical protein [Saccharopolyspora sp. 6V]MCA1195133.1 hypothetical protein [Saccharopolyspora sp. 6V]
MKSPSPGVPIWVPIAVAILGIIGIIAGQLINTWREERRWRREEEREEVRHLREKEKEKLQREHDNVLDWRGRRIEAYADALDHIDDIRGALGDVVRAAIDYRPTTEDAAALLRYTQIHAERISRLRAVDSASKGMSSLRLLATEPVQRKLDACMIALSKATNTAIKNFEADAESTQFNVETIDFEDKIDALRESIRTELGIAGTVDDLRHDIGQEPER